MNLQIKYQLFTADLLNIIRIFSLQLVSDTVAESSTEYKPSQKETKQSFWLADQGLLSSPLQNNPLQKRSIPINSKQLCLESFTYHRGGKQRLY